MTNGKNGLELGIVMDSYFLNYNRCNNMNLTIGNPVSTNVIIFSLKMKCLYRYLSIHFE